MGILTNKEANDKTAPFPLQVDVCFFCGGDLFNDKKNTGGVVFWQGYEGQIALHQGCAELFSIHLIQDARSLASIVKKRVKLTTRGKCNDKDDMIWFMKN